METLRYSLIGREDLRLDPRAGTFEVTLADGRVVNLHAVDIAHLIGDAYLEADIPSGLVTGQMIRRLDGPRGLWSVSKSGRLFSLTGEMFNVQEFGAVPDGMTDCGPAIREVYDAMDDGDVMYFPPSRDSYIVDPSWDSSLIVCPLTGKLNTKIIGAGRDVATIKVKSGVGNYVGIFCSEDVDPTTETDTSGLEVRTLTIDSNIAGNPIGGLGNFQVSAPGGHLTRRNPIHTRRGSNIVVDGCRFVDAPRQGVNIACNEALASAEYVSRVWVTKNLVQTTHDGVGTPDFDNTGILVRGRHMHVAHNVLQGLPTNYFLSRTAIFAGGPDVVVAFNTIDKYYRSIQVGSVEHALVADGITVVGNVATNANSGIEIHSVTSDDLVVGPGVKNCIISSNTLHTNKNVYARQVTDTDTPDGIKLFESSDLSIENVSIVGNVVDHVAYVAAGGGYGINLEDGATVSGTHKNIRLANNIITNPSRMGININLNAVQGLVIDSNTVIDPGQSTSLSGVNDAGIRVTGGCDDVVINDNTVIDTRATAILSAAIYLNPTSASTNVRTRGNVMRVADAAAAPTIPIVNVFSNNPVPHIEEVVDYHVAITNNTKYGSQVVEMTTGTTYVQMARPSGAIWVERDRAASPTQIAANQNNYSPSLAEVWRLSSDASRDITGIDNGVDGRKLTIINVGAQNIRLMNQNVGSTDINRIITGTAGDVTIAPDDTAMLVYDAVTTRWRVVNTY